MAARITSSTAEAALGSDARLERLPGLSKPPAPRLLDDQRGQGDRPGAPALGFLLADPARVVLLGEERK
jgi:hypothetical protein